MEPIEVAEKLADPAQGAGRMESKPRQANIAALVSEMNSIHSANSLYWELGEAVNLEARAEHQRRRDRLEELRTVLEKLQVRSAKGTKATPVQPRLNSEKTIER
ncbi:MAG: hypothetical protein WBM24_15465 [Candidatus Sulfotelmatobacter sp.]